MDVVRSRSKAHSGASPDSKQGRSAAKPEDERQAAKSPFRRASDGVGPPASRRQRRPRVRGLLSDSLHAEITALERARSVVDCLAAAMEAGARNTQGPYFPDVAHAASQMMTRTIVTLSDLLLDSNEELP